MTSNDETGRDGLADVEEIVSLIRRFVNEPRKQNEIIKRGAVWHQLCSAMDLVGDTEWALDSHARGEHAASSAGMLYLAHYGFLQAAYLQQDAVLAIQQCLGVTGAQHRVDPALTRIRHVRNQAVGHPAGGRFGAVHFVVRATMRPHGFELMSIGDDGSVEQQSVDCRELRLIQNREIASILRQVVQGLDEETRMHKARFKAQPLSPELEKLSYPVGKIFETGSAMQRGSIAPGLDLGPLGLGEVEAAVTRLRAKLTERGYEPGVLPGADMAFDAITHAVTRLRGLFASDAGELEGRDAEAFATHLDVHLKELIEIAREIDEDYGSTLKRRPAPPAAAVKVVIRGRKRPQGAKNRAGRGSKS
jgi:hypothetical protein